MTVLCPAPDTSLGVANRLSGYLDCHARVLGENGFQALAGGAMGTSLLSGLVTVFVALVGYRLMLGYRPEVRDGVGLAVRLGIVLALVTSWPAFQALVYRVAVDAPAYIAAVLLPATGVPGENLDARVQQGYDTLRLGMTNGQAVGQEGQPGAQTPLVEPLKKTASLLVISTAGLAGALRIAIGFLLAVAPLAVMGLLFSGTHGLFVGWLRAVAGMALGLVGATVVTAVHLLALESELAHLQALGTTEAGDPQALTTIVLVFALTAVVTTLAAMRMGNALQMPITQTPPLLQAPRSRAKQPLSLMRPEMIATEPGRGVAGTAAHARAAAVAKVLATAVHREQRHSGFGGNRQSLRFRQSTTAEAVGDRVDIRTIERIGLAGRRTLGRNTRSSARRDKIA